MKRVTLAYLVTVALLLAGCGDSDNFVFTGTNNNPNPGPVAGVPTQLAFVTNPAQTVDTDFSTAPVVEVQDAFGNRVPGDTTAITVSLVNPGGATLNGQTTRNAVDGRAVFTGLSVDQPGSYTLQASAAGLQGDTSATFVVKRLALYAAHREGSINSPTQPSILVELNPETGATVGSLGQIGDGTVFGQVSGLECVPDGTLFGIAEDLSNSARHLLIRIDPADPTDGTSVVGEINDDVFGRIHDLAYDSNSQTMYASASDVVGMGDIDFYILTINTSTGAGTPFANPTFNETNQIGSSIAFDNSTNTLFFVKLLSNSDEELYSINTTTGAPTLIGTADATPTDNVIGISGMDVNPVTNELFFATRNSSDAGDFGTLNKTTGARTIIGPIINTSDIAFCEDAPVEPATGSL